MVRLAVVVLCVGVIFSFVGTCLFWKTFADCKEEISSEEYFLAHLFVGGVLLAALAAYVDNAVFMVIGFGLFAAGVTDNDLALFGERFTLVDLDLYGQLLDHPAIIEGFSSCEDYVIGGAAMAYVGTGFGLLAAGAILSKKHEEEGLLGAKGRGARMPTSTRVLYFCMHGLFWLGGFFLLYGAPRYTINAGVWVVNDDYYYRIFTITVVEYMVLAFILFHMAFLSASPLLYVASGFFNSLAIVYTLSEYLFMQQATKSKPSFEIVLGFVLLWLALILMAFLAAIIHKEVEETNGHRRRGGGESGTGGEERASGISETSPFIVRYTGRYPDSEV